MRSIIGVSLGVILAFISSGAIAQSKSDYDVELELCSELVGELRNDITGIAVTGPFSGEFVKKFLRAPVNETAKYIDRAITKKSIKSKDRLVQRALTSAGKFSTYLDWLNAWGVIDLESSSNPDLANDAQGVIDCLNGEYDPNTPPVADAGNGFSAAVDVAAFVDGRASFDPDGDDLTYTWTIKTTPATTPITTNGPAIENPSASVARFIADREGTFVLLLTVSDGRASATDEVEIIADLDGDGTLSTDDLDRDGDGVLNEDDVFPDDPAEFADADGNTVGNLAQTDEDGDGVTDDQDQQPFDSTSSLYPLTLETEFNDNPTQADRTNSTYPLRVEGAISQNVDADYFRFTADAGVLLTAALYKSAGSFQPSLTIADLTGRPLASVKPNYDEARPFNTAVTTLIPNNGDYLLIVSEANSANDPSFIYAVELFRDADIDALDDDRELANGVNPFSPDSDADTIFDSSEATIGLVNPGAIVPLPMRTSADIDADGRPNWFDGEADGDLVSDRTEGPGDADKDGEPNFADADSDGNGILDTDEVGVNPLIPLDTDGDGNPDFLDLDDDNDGLLDLNDPERLIPLVPSSSLAGPYITEVAGVINTESVVGVARAGDRVQVSGIGFSAISSENLIVLLGAGGPWNITPDTLSTELLEFTMPDEAVTELFVISAGAVSNYELLMLTGGQLPVVFEPSSLIAIVGQPFVLNGLNLNGPISVNIGGAIASATGASSGNSVTFTVPANASAGPAVVSNSFGLSNTFRMNVEKTVPGTIILPAGFPVPVTDLTVDVGIQDFVTPASDGSFTTRIANNQAAFLTASLPPVGTDFPVPLLMFYSVPGDTSVEFSFLSTAVAQVMNFHSADLLMPGDQLAAARAAVGGLPEVQNLAAEMAAAATIDPYILGNTPTGTLLSAWLSALQATEDYLRALTGIGSAAFSATASAIEATITPTEQYDISVKQRDEPDDNNILVENDTQLFLSTAIIATDTKQPLVLQTHVSGGWDRKIAGPQNRGLLFFASETPFDQPMGRDSRVEIITAGFAAPLGSSIVRRHVVLRTTIDGVLAPLLGKLIGTKIEGKCLANALNAAAPGLLTEMYSDFNAGNFTGVQGRFIDALFVELTTPPLGGPIVSELIKCVGPWIVGQISLRLGINLTPYGWVLTGYDFGALAIPLAKLATDTALTPGQLEPFIVNFPLEVTGVSPTSITKSNADIEITLTGTGFEPDTSGGGSKVPVVALNDIGSNSSFLVDGHPNNSAGTELLVTIPGWYRNFITGPLELEVRHRNEIEVAPEQIEIVTLQIDSLSPDSGGQGMDVTITGAGFATNAFENTVTFAGPSGARLPALITSATESTINAVVPNGVETGDVTVEIGGEVSNGVTFTVDVTNVLIAFGDNGGVNDDTFALYVDGNLIRTMSAPSRRVEASLQLSPGTHSAALRGITAPDAIGTYYISFEQGVISASGDALQGSDLTAGTQKNYSIEVGTTATASSLQPAATQPMLLQQE